MSETVGLKLPVVPKAVGMYESPSSRCCYVGKAIFFSFFSHSLPISQRYSSSDYRVYFARPPSQLPCDLFDVFPAGDKRGKWRGDSLASAHLRGDIITSLDKPRCGVTHFSHSFPPFFLQPLSLSPSSLLILNGVSACLCLSLCNISMCVSVCTSCGLFKKWPISGAGGCTTPLWLARLLICRYCSSCFICQGLSLTRESCK